MIFDIALITSSITLVLLVWFNSEAFVEYASLASGEKFFLIDTYKEKQKDRAALTYLEHISEERKTFFVKLITCELCLSVWLSLLITLLLSESLILFPVCNVISLFIYKGLAKLLES